MGLWQICSKEATKQLCKNTITERDKLEGKYWSGTGLHKLDVHKMLFFFTHSNPAAYWEIPITSG